MLDKLNKEQYLAATADFGRNLIIASAGTGKTSTIVGRISFLLNKGIKPQEILLLTFTNKASIEMIDRVSNFFSKELTQNIVYGTFHSVSYKLLKDFVNITLKQPKELKILFKAIYEKIDFEIDDFLPYDGSYLYDLYSLYLNSTYNISFENWLLENFEEHKHYIPYYIKAIEEFNKIKKEYSYVSFDDLLTFMLDYANKFSFKEILVDEYQDTNPLQDKLLNSFDFQSLFCVGDYDQSIYGFNGADINIINSFTKRYKNAKVYTLSKNYRSTKLILELANRVISYNERIYPKKLEVIRDEEAISPKLLVFDEVFNQYNYIASNIENSLNNYNDIAVIFRNNSSADGIELFLREKNIPTKRKGGHSFFDLKEIKFIIDVISIIFNKDDLMAFINVLEYAKGIGKALAKDIFEALLNLGNNNIIDGLLNPLDIKNPYNKRISQVGLFDESFELGSVSRFAKYNFEDRFLENNILKNKKISPEGANYIYKLYLLAKKLRRYKNPRAVIDNIYESLLFDEFRETLATKRATQKDKQINLEYVEIVKKRIDKKVNLLRNLANKFDNIYSFLNSMVLSANEIGPKDGVNLLTVHSSKGLEFKEVYIIDLAQDRFPNKKLIQKGSSIEEERRLFYVAVTRAKDILYLSYAKFDKMKNQYYQPSIFLKEAKLI